MIISKRKSLSGLADNLSESSNNNEDLKSIIKILLTAIKSENEEVIGEALRAAFELFDSQPHTESPNTNTIE